MSVIAQYVEQVLKPKNLSSAIILNALRKKMDSDPDAVLGILLSWSRETALAVFTEYIERIAMSDPEKMVAMYDKWKSKLDSDILKKIVERSRPKTKQADLDRIRALIVKARSQK
jgi:DNA-binding transcriptional regulator YbjK